MKIQYLRPAPHQPFPPVRTLVPQRPMTGILEPAAAISTFPTSSIRGLMNHNILVYPQNCPDDCKPCAFQLINFSNQIWWLSFSLSPVTVWRLWWPHGVLWQCRWRSRDPLVIFINLTPYITDIADEKCVTIHEGDEDFPEAANAMADECDLYRFRGMLYNMPARVNPALPYHCITRGRYIGVFEQNCW